MTLTTRKLPDASWPPRQPTDPRLWMRTQCLCVAGYSVLLLIAWSILGINTSYPGDEERFIQSSLNFAGLPSLELLRSYEEMSSPLPFWYWGNWAAFLGDSLASMRASTLLWGMLASWLLFSVLAMLLGSLRHTVIVWIIIVLHPYWWTMSIFAYTDIFGIAGLLAAALGVSRGQGWLTGLGVMVSLLSRQYLIFALPALTAIALTWHGQSPSNMRRQVIAIAMGTLPFLGLIVLWQGLQPQNSVSQLYKTGLMTWSIDSFFLYISLIGIYGCICWLISGQRLIPRRWEWVCVAIGCLAGLIIQVQPSPVAWEGGYTTVGLFDLFISRVLHLPLWLKQLIWTLGLVIGLLWLWRVGHGAWVTLRRQNMLGTHAFSWIMVASLLIIMPLSYLHWEKYFLPVLPWVAAGFLYRPWQKSQKESTPSSPQGDLNL